MVVLSVRVGGFWPQTLLKGHWEVKPGTVGGSLNDPCMSSKHLLTVSEESGGNGMLRVREVGRRTAIRRKFSGLRHFSSIGTLVPLSYQFGPSLTLTAWCGVTEVTGVSVAGQWLAPKWLCSVTVCPLELSGGLASRRPGPLPTHPL